MSNPAISAAIILDTPNQIQAYRLLAIRAGLAMEIRMKEEHGMPPTACPTRGRALRTARQELGKRKLIGPGTDFPNRLTRKQALSLMTQVCIDHNLIQEAS